MGEEHDMGRREFLASLATGASEPKMTMRTNLKGEKVSLLGYGAMRLPTIDGGHANNWMKDASQTAIDQEAVNRHIDYALEHGVNYFDTSPAYCRGESETILGNALSRHPRSSYYIATKLSNFDPSTWPLEQSKAMFERSLANLKTTYIDYYLLHSIGNGGFEETFKKRYIENGALDWLVEERAAGRIRNLGFSFHGDPRAFEWCIENHAKYKWDFCQIQMNYVDWLHAQEVNARNLNGKYLYETLEKNNIPAVIMEPLLGGRLAKFNYAVAEKLKSLDSEKSLASWSFRFCGSFPGVLTILSGMTRKEHLEENIAALSPLEPLNETEFATLEEAAQLLLASKTIPCTDCKYCRCPYGLDIPGVFQIWNKACVEDCLPDDPSAPDYAEKRKRFLKEYDAALPHLRQAEHCIGCSRCVSHCPQTINIPKELAMIDRFTANLRKEERNANW